MDGELTIGVVPAGLCEKSRNGLALDSLVVELELYKYLANSSGIKDFGKRIRALLLPLGINHYSHSNLNLVIDVLDLFGTVPPAFAAQYAKEEFYRDDLISRHMMVSDKPIFEMRFLDYLQGAPIESDLLKRNMEILKLMRGHGMENVFSLPIVNDDQRAVFTVSARGGDRANFENTILRNLPALTALAKVVDDVGRRKFPTRFHGGRGTSPVRINVRPLELLDVLARKDLTLNEAAAVLNISISTANQMIAAAKKAFGVQTTIGAVVAAMRAGYIVLDP